MGFAKSLLIEEQERGCSSVGGHVCAGCFNDIGIKKFIEDHAEHYACGFCHNNSDMPIAASLEDVVGHIVKSIRSEWEPVEECGAPWDSEEKEFATEYVDTDDILYNEGLETSSRILWDKIMNSIGTLQWSRQFGSIPQDKMLLFDWDDFSGRVKHKTRFFFYKSEAELEKNIYEVAANSPHVILDHIASRVNSLGLVSILPKGKEIIRIRVSGEKRYDSVEELGPPPAESAKYPNRMNPAGISMFYGSDTVKTALAETRGDRKDPGIASIGTFELLQDLTILDLTNLPPVPSIFEDKQRSNRHFLIFFHKFCKEFSRVITKDERVHIEYVPTQIVTEYFRYMYKSNGRPIDGIKYKSSRDASGDSYVLFVDPKDCTDVIDKNENDFVKHHKLQFLSSKTDWQSID